MANDSHLSQPKPEKDSSPVPQRHRNARGENVTGQRDMNRGAPHGKPTPKHTY